MSFVNKAPGAQIPTECREQRLTLQRFATIEALVLNRSSRVMPGLRGTPAGMTTISAPLNESFSCNKNKEHSDSLNIPRPNGKMKLKNWSD